MLLHVWKETFLNGKGLLLLVITFSITISAFKMFAQMKANTSANNVPDFSYKLTSYSIRISCNCCSWLHRPNESKPWSDLLPNRLIIFIVSLRMPSTFDVWISGFDSIITACGKNAEATLWINTELLFFRKIVLGSGAYFESDNKVVKLQF